MGGGFDLSAMGAMSTCHKWEPWSGGGHRERAIELVDQAILQVREGIKVSR